MFAFLRPTLWKIALAGGLFLAASTLWRAFVTSRMTDTFPHRFPLPFYMGWGPCPPGQSCSEFNVGFLFLDGLVWYAVSAFFVYRLQRR